MDEALKACVDHHRGIVAGHAQTPRTIPLESVTICLLAGIHEALMANKAAHTPKKGKTPK